MSVVFVQAASGTLSSSGVSLNISITTTLGNCLLAFIRTESTSNSVVTNITDTAGNTWVPVIDLDNGPVIGAGRINFWITQSAKAVTSVTVAFNQSNNHSMIVLEYSGVVNVGGVGSGLTTSTSTAPTASAMAPSTALVLGGILFENQGAVTASTGTLRKTQTGQSGDSYTIAVIDVVPSGSPSIGNPTASITSAAWISCALVLLGTFTKETTVTQNCKRQ